MHGSMIFAGSPHTREASGTPWQPDATPMPAWHNPTRSTGSCMAQRSLDERADLMLGAKLSLVP